MLAKGIIDSIDFSSNTCIVRIPQFETANSDPIIISATFSITPGMYNGYKENDVVWVAFENDKLEHPVVIGKLFLGTEKENKDPRGTINCMISTTSQKANIPQDTVLTNEVGDDIPNTQVPYNNINELANKLNDVDVNLEYSVRDIDNRIKMKVNAVDGNAAWGWELSPSGWSITSDGEEFFTVNNEGMTVKNKGKIGQFIIGAEHDCTITNHSESGIYTDGYYDKFEASEYRYSLSSAPAYLVVVKQKGLADNLTNINILDKYAMNGLLGSTKLTCFNTRTVIGESENTTVIEQSEIDPNENDDLEWSSRQLDKDTSILYCGYNNSLVCYCKKTTEEDITTYTYLNDIYYIHNLENSSFLVKEPTSGNYAFVVTGENVTNVTDYTAVYLQCDPADVSEAKFAKEDENYFYKYNDIFDDNTGVSKQIKCSQFDTTKLNKIKNGIKECLDISESSDILVECPETFESRNTYFCLLKVTIKGEISYYLRLTTASDCFIHPVNNFEYLKTERNETGVYLGTDGIRVGNFQVDAGGTAKLAGLTLNDLKISKIIETNLQDGNRNAIGCNIADAKLNADNYINSFKINLDDIKNLDIDTSIQNTLKTNLNTINGDTYLIASSAENKKYITDGKYSIYSFGYDYLDTDKKVSPFYLGLPVIGSLLTANTDYTFSAKVMKLDDTSSWFTSTDYLYAIYYDKDNSIFKISRSYPFKNKNDSQYISLKFKTGAHIGNNARIFILGASGAVQTYTTSTSNFQLSELKVEKGTEATEFSYSANDMIDSTIGIAGTITLSGDNITERYINENFSVNTVSKIANTSGVDINANDTFLVAATASDTSNVYSIFCSCISATTESGATNLVYRVISRQQTLGQTGILDILSEGGNSIILKNGGTYQLNIQKISDGGLSSGITVGGFHITNNAANPNAIYSGITSFNDSQHTEGVYLGTDGINIGQKFKVDNEGNITAIGLAAEKIEVTDEHGITIFKADNTINKAKIGGFNVTANTLQSDATIQSPGHFCLTNEQNVYTYSAYESKLNPDEGNSRECVAKITFTESVYQTKLFIKLSSGTSDDYLNVSTKNAPEVPNSRNHTYCYKSIDFNNWQDLTDNNILTWVEVPLYNISAGDYVYIYGYLNTWDWENYIAMPGPVCFAIRSSIATISSVGEYYTFGAESSLNLTAADIPMLTIANKFNIYPDGELNLDNVLRVIPNGGLGISDRVYVNSTGNITATSITLNPLPKTGARFIPMAGSDTGYWPFGDFVGYAAKYIWQYLASLNAGWTDITSKIPNELRKKVVNVIISEEAANTSGTAKATKTAFYKNNNNNHTYVYTDQAISALIFVIANGTEEWYT